MSVALEEVIDAFLVMTPHFNQRGGCTDRVDVLLSLRSTTEATVGLVNLLCQRAPFGKICSVSHPIENVFHPPANLSGRFAFGSCQGRHKRSTKFCPAHRFVGIYALHVPCRDISPKVKVLGTFW